MNISPGRLGSFFGGLYTWIVTVFFGAIMLDIVYANLVNQAAPAFSEVSDFLLLLGAFTIPAAIGAIAFSWKSSVARNYFIASLAIILLEFLGPAFFSPLIQDMQDSILPTIVRIIISGLASILAFIGLHKLYR